MTVYVVTEGDYSDYHICAVFSSREQAQRYIDTHSLFDVYASYDIEDYEMDVTLQSKYLFVTYNYNTSHILDVDEYRINGEPNCFGCLFQFFVEKSSRVIDEKTGLLKKDVLLKIAQDEYAMYKAQKEGIV